VGPVQIKRDAPATLQPAQERSRVFFVRLHQLLHQPHLKGMLSLCFPLIVFTELQLNAFCFDADALQGLLANPASATSKLDPLQLEIPCRVAEAVRTHSAMGGLGNQQL